MKIYLVGMPASGKSTIARQLSRELNLKLIDLDQEIVKAVGKSINDIFNEQGEDYFRELETQVLVHHTRENHDFIMATGGGAACFNDNMHFMNEAGVTIFINTPLEDITARLSGQGRHHRPLVKGIELSELKEAISRKWEDRRTFYEKAKLVYDPTQSNTSLIALIYNYQK